MSLYDDLDTDKKSENVSGWASGIKFLQNHMHLKKAGVTVPKRDQVRKTAILAPVVDLNKSKIISSLKDDLDDNVGPGGPSFTLPYSITTTVKETRKKGGKFRSPYLSSDPQWQFENEYDPMYPNDYEKALKDLRERRDKEAEEEENKRKQEEVSREEDEYVPPPPSAKSSVGGVAIAPPSSYGLTELLMEPMDTSASGNMGSGNSAVGVGSGASAAARIMAKYGYKEGQGLGKMQQGMATALQVEKTSHRTGRIIHEKDEPKGILLNSFTSGGIMPTSLVQYTDADDIIENDLDDIGTPSKVILLKNMVGPGEVDDDLEPEVKDECQTKYGDVESVTVFQMPDVDSDDAIRIFVDFKKVDDASKAIQDLNGRFFGGRQVRAAYYDLDKFHNLELTD